MASITIPGQGAFDIVTPQHAANVVASFELLDDIRRGNTTGVIDLNDACAEVVDRATAIADDLASSAELAYGFFGINPIRVPGSSVYEIPFDVESLEWPTWDASPVLRPAILTAPGGLLVPAGELAGVLEVNRLMLVVASGACEAEVVVEERTSFALVGALGLTVAGAALLAAFFTGKK